MIFYTISILSYTHKNYKYGLHVFLMYFTYYAYVPKALLTLSKSSLNGIYPKSCCSCNVISNDGNGVVRLGERGPPPGHVWSITLLLMSAVNVAEKQKAKQTFH